MGQECLHIGENHHPLKEQKKEVQSVVSADASDKEDGRCWKLHVNEKAMDRNKYPKEILGDALSLIRR
jgi:hypothetical protein